MLTETGREHPPRRPRRLRRLCTGSPRRACVTPLALFIWLLPGPGALTAGNAKFPPPACGASFKRASGGFWNHPVLPEAYAPPPTWGLGGAPGRETRPPQQHQLRPGAWYSRVDLLWGLKYLKFFALKSIINCGCCYLLPSLLAPEIWFFLSRINFVCSVIFHLLKNFNQLPHLRPSLYPFLAGPSPSAHLPHHLQIPSCFLCSVPTYLSCPHLMSVIKGYHICPFSSHPIYPTHWNLAASTHSTQTVLSKVLSDLVMHPNEHFSMLLSLQLLTHLSETAANPSVIHNAHTPGFPNSLITIFARSVSSFPCPFLLAPTHMLPDLLFFFTLHTFMGWRSP